jgi:signal transduction histidine kinase
MADVSATALGDWLLAEDAARQTSSLAATLAGDPPLALWVLWSADRAAGDRPRGLTEAARWLAEHILDEALWQDRAAGAGEPEPDRIEDYSGRVATAVAVSEVARRLAAPGGESVERITQDSGGKNAFETVEIDRQERQSSVRHAPADRAALLGLLHDAAAVPSWFLPAADEPAAVAVARAVALLRGDGDETAAPVEVDLASRTRSVDTLGATAGLSSSAGNTAGQANRGTLPFMSAVALEACRRRGDEAQQRWLAAGGPAASWLPQLAARLARLATLQRRFAEAVETEKIEALAEFAAGAAHEINNPLAVIAGRAQLFLREETEPERRKALALINAQAMRVHEMIADLRLFARPPQPELQTVDPLGLLDRLIEEMAPVAARQETVLQRRGDAGPLAIEADPVQLMVALRALCSNALEALGHGGIITVAVRRADRGVQISVADDGPGISPEERRHLFDPFYSARQAGRGLGLGLSKCWRIVAQHGGQIAVEAGPGRGAIFTITLPGKR